MLNLSDVSIIKNNESLYTLFTQNKVIRKTSQIGKNIFNYFCRNQYALQVAIWSYLAIEVTTSAVEIEVTTSAVESDTLASGMDLYTCQSLICDIWKETPKVSVLISPSHTLPALVAPRCDPSYTDYRPYNFLSTCLDDLCDYTQKGNVPLSVCMDYVVRNINPDENNGYLTNSIIEKICPWKEIEHKDSTTQALHLTNCLKQICDHANLFKVSGNEEINRICNNPGLGNMNNIIEKLSKIFHAANKKIEESDTWGQANTIFAIIASITSMGGSIVACWATYMTLRMSVGFTTAATGLFSLQQGLADMLGGIARTTQALTQIDLPEIESPVNIESPVHIESDNIIREVRELINEITDTVEYSFTHEEMTVPKGNEMENIRDSGIKGIVEKAVGSPGSFLGGLPFNTPAIAKGIITGLLNLGSEKESMPPNSQSDEGEMTKVFVDNRSEEERYIQNFVHDQRVFAADKNELVMTQMSRLKLSIENWSNAFCFYRHRLFCRFPLKEYVNSKVVQVPIEYFEKITFDRLPGVCYSIFNDLWCNWSKAIEILSGKTDTIIIDGYCPWDAFSLQLERLEENIDSYKITALGNCFNQTAIIKV